MFNFHIQLRLKMTSMFYMIEKLTPVNKAIKNDMSCTPFLYRNII